MNSNRLTISAVGVSLLVFGYAVIVPIIENTATEAAIRETDKVEARMSDAIKSLRSDNKSDHSKIESTLIRLDSKIDKIIMLSK